MIIRNIVYSFLHPNYPPALVSVMLNSNFLGAFSSNFILPLFYSFVLFDSVSEAIISIWLLINLSAFFLRLSVCNTLSKQLNESAEQLTNTLRYYYIVIGFSGFVWGAFTFYIVQSASDKIVSLSIVILIGLTAGAISTLGTIFNVFIVFVVSILFPLVIGLLMLDDFAFNSIAIMLFIYMYVISKGTYRHYRQIKSNLDINEQLAKSQQEAEEANKAKSQFLANMSHEIRTPINAILGFTELSLKSDSKNDEYLKTVMKSSQHLLHIINEILDLSKVEAGEIIFEREVFDINKVFIDNEKTARLLVKDKNIHLEFSIDSNLPSLLKGDALRINQIMMNLISNAVKFTEAGEISIIINVDNQSVQKIYLVISICDTGIGLSKEQQKKLFKNFSQADSTITKKYGGTGLGLAICKQMIEKMGGSIIVNSELHEGSCFIVNIPFELPSEAEIQYFQQQQLNDLYNQNINYDSLDLGKILLVEDNEVNQMLAETIILEAGYEVITVANGKEAVDKLQLESVNLILMDINMPEMDGYEATKIIREELQKKSLPIIAMTANALTGDREKALNAGMDDYISKPISSIALLQKISQWYGKSQWQANIKPLKQAETITQLNNKLFQQDQVGEGERTSNNDELLKELTLDRSMLDDIIALGKTELVDKLITKFIDYTPEQINELKVCSTSKQWTDFKKKVHSLKSSSANLGANKLSSYCAVLESASIEELERVSDSSIESIQKEFELVREVLLTTFKN